jgi:hypothetical protein
VENGFVTEYKFASEVLLSCLEVLEEYHSKLFNGFRPFGLLHVTTVGGCTPLSQNFAHHRLRNA